MKGDSVLEETDSREEDREEWKGNKVESKETEQEGVVYAQSEESFDDRVLRTDNEEGQVKSGEGLQQTDGMDLGAESEQAGVPSEATEETSGNPKVSVHVKGPSSNSQRQEPAHDEEQVDVPSSGPGNSVNGQQQKSARDEEQEVVPFSGSGKGVNKAPAGHRRGEKESEVIPDLTRQPLEEEEGDGEGPAYKRQTLLSGLIMYSSSICCIWTSIHSTCIANVLVCIHEIVQ